MSKLANGLTQKASKKHGKIKIDNSFDELMNMLDMPVKK